MGWLGLDWGNVPGWFSAASFTAAAYVIFRDREHRRRQQVDSVGVWVEVEDFDSEPVSCAEITPRVHVKNASNLPVHVSKIVFRVYYEWFPEESYHGDEFELAWEETYLISGKVDYISIPPGREITEKHDPVTVRRAPRSRDEGENYRIRRIQGVIKSYDVLDNAQNIWHIEPVTASLMERSAESISNFNGSKKASDVTGLANILRFRKLCRRLMSRGRRNSS